MKPNKFLNLAVLALLPIFLTSQSRSESFDDNLGIEIGTSSHLSPVEGHRFSQEVRLLAMNLKDSLSGDVRIIRINRSGFFSARPSWGIGVGVSYYFVHPDPPHHGFLLGTGLGIYHYFAGDPRYTKDPFVEASAGYFLPLSSETAFLVQSGLGAYPYLAGSEYMSGVSPLDRLRMRLSVTASLQSNW